MFSGSDFRRHNGFDREELSNRLFNAGFCDFNYKTVYQRVKDVGGIRKSFPIFLAAAKLA